MANAEDNADRPTDNDLPELVYFDASGRAELTRLVFVAGGIHFKDTRLSFADYGRLSQDPLSDVNQLFGSLPYVKHNGRLFSQSLACAFYAAELGLWRQGVLGAGVEALKNKATDMMVACVNEDVRAAMFKCRFGAEASKAAAKKALPGMILHYLGSLERQLARKSVGGPYFFAGRPSVADLAVFDNVRALKELLDMDVAGFPLITDLVKAVERVPAVDAYLTKLAHPSLASSRQAVGLEQRQEQKQLQQEQQQQPQQQQREQQQQEQQQPQEQQALGTMQAVVYSQSGNPGDVLSIVTLPKPVLGPRDVLVKVVGTGINPVDWKIMTGRVKFPYHAPVIPCWDVAGVVEALGPEVTAFRVGDAVYGYHRRDVISTNGTLAEYVSVDQDQLALKPSTATFLQAAAMPIASLTAYQGLSKLLKPGAGATVLITGASSGVGGFAIQLAKASGCTVVATASAANVQYAAQLGADHVIDYTLGPVDEQVRALFPEGVDCCFDAVGDKSIFGAVAPAGSIVSAANLDVASDARAAGRTGSVMYAEPNSSQLAEIAGLFDAGNLSFALTVYRGLGEAARCMAASMGGRTVGKLVLEVSAPDTQAPVSGRDSDSDELDGQDFAEATRVALLAAQKGTTFIATRVPATATSE